MRPEMVEVDSPGSPFHGRRGAVIQIAGGRHKLYTVEFFDGRRYELETFKGDELKILIGAA